MARPLAAALRELRSGRDKAVYYRKWRLRLRAGLSHPDAPAPGRSVPFEQALLKVGEETGALEECLRLLADYFAAEDRMALKVLRRAAYPMTILLAATFIAPAPLLFTASTATYLATVAAGLVLWAAAGGSLFELVVRTFLGRPQFVLGRLLRALTIAVEAGLPLGRAVELAATAAGNDSVVEHVRAQGALTVSRQSLSRTFAGCPFVPRAALASMEVADASGNYGDTLRRLADLYQS